MANSFLDSIMPVFAGNVWFWPVILVSAFMALWKGGARGRLCLIMLAIALVAGDCWITHMLKDVVGRPRPCFTLSDINLPMTKSVMVDTTSDFRDGCSSTGSFPSGHTTNWFATAMVGWLYYRRTLRLLLPLACIVAFSRIYNGVHYPSDVIGGALIGAAYGFCFVYLVNGVWQKIGPTWFPVWYRRLPILILREQLRDPAPLARPSAAQSNIDAHWLKLGYILAATLFLGRIWYLSRTQIELSEDEAYQWLWSKRLALSYFSKPPLIAYVQWLGTRIFGDTEFGVRFFSPFLMSLGSVMLLRFFAKHVNARAGFWLIVVLNLTPLLAIGSTLLTIDILLSFFWALAMLAGWRAVQPDGSARHWCFVGLFMGLAFLSKYTALLQWLSWAVFFALAPAARVHLRRPGPYLAIAINLLFAVPVIIWNAQHGWISASHVANDAKLNEAWRYDPMHLLEFTGSAFAVLNPFFFAAMVWACVAFWKRSTPLLRYFFAMGAPLFIVYLLYTIHSGVLVNWIAASIIPLLCLTVAYWHDRDHAGTAPAVRKIFAIAIVFGAVAVAFLHETKGVMSMLDTASRQFTGKPLPPGADPLRRVRGWRRMARLVEKERLKLEAEGKPAFVVAAHYGTASVLSFYTPAARRASRQKPLVYFRATSRPKNQFYYWPTYTGIRRGENALYVKEKDKAEPVPRDIIESFESVELVGRIPVVLHDRVMHTVHIFACRNLLK